MIIAKSRRGVIHTHPCSVRDGLLQCLNAIFRYKPRAKSCRGRDVCENAHDFFREFLLYKLKQPAAPFWKYLKYLKFTARKKGMYLPNFRLLGLTVYAVR